MDSELSKEEIKKVKDSTFLYFAFYWLTGKIDQTAFATKI
jgi:hypothetical protein